MDELGDIVSDSDLIAFVREAHHQAQDIDEGDLIERIERFDRYELVELPMSALDLREWYSDEDLVDEYADDCAHSEPPPIIFQPVYETIVDGTHRANALARLGRTTIRAWVPVMS